MSEVTDPRLTTHHPRLRHVIHGQSEAERKLLSSYRSGRMHHAWLFTGPRGIGKATMAYRLARFVLRYPDPASAPDADLTVAEDDHVSKRIASRGHSDLLVIERQFDAKAKRLKQEIGATDARRAGTFFSQTAGEEGWRVCIVDAADDLNATSANALLKILEEPPQRALFILVSHTPGRLLPTIRSRCLPLEFSTLSEETIAQILDEVCSDASGQVEAIARLAGGSAGRALELLQSGATEMFLRFERMMKQNSRFDHGEAAGIAGKLSLRGHDEDYRLFCELLQQRLMQEALQIVQNNGSSRLAARWAKQSSELSHSIRRANALNLDRREVMLQAFESVDELKRAGRFN